MNSSNPIYRAFIGIVDKPVKLLVSSFVVYAAGWTILEPLLSIVPSIGGYLSGWSRFTILVLISLMVGLVTVTRPKKLSFHFQNNIVSIQFNDLFSLDGLTVIPVSQFMLETEVVSTSLQNWLIRQFIDSSEGVKGIASYKQKLETALKDKPFNVITREPERGTEKYYSLGTTALLEHKGNDYLLLAVTRTELKGHITRDNCNVTNLWIALENLWKEVRIHARGRDINIPLLGSGVTGINLPSKHILELNLLAILNAIVDGGKITSGEMRIILHPKYFEEIDLDDFRKIWSGSG